MSLLLPQAYSVWYGPFSAPAKVYIPPAVDPGSDGEAVELYPGGHGGGADSPGSDEDGDMGGGGSGSDRGKGVQAAAGSSSGDGGGGTKGVAQERAGGATVVRRRGRRMREAEQLREGLIWMLNRWRGSPQLRRLAEADAELCTALRELQGAQQERGEGAMEEEAAEGAEEHAGACAGGGGPDRLRLRMAAARGKYDEAYASLRWLFEVRCSRGGRWHGSRASPANTCVGMMRCLAIVYWWNARALPMAY